MRCNHCKEEMDAVVVPFYATERKVQGRTMSGYCVNRICPSYALLQVPQEMMPKSEKRKTDKERADIYYKHGDEWVRMADSSRITFVPDQFNEKPTKARSEGKDGFSTSDCQHEFIMDVHVRGKRTTYYLKCLKCGNVKTLVEKEKHD